MQLALLCDHTAHGRNAMLRRAGSLWLVAVIATACGGGSDVTDPATGSIRITIATAGVMPDLDLDGYLVLVDEGPAKSTAIEGTITIGGVSAGSRLVRLIGLAPKCSVMAPHPVRVDVAAGSVASLHFAVVCAGTPGGGPWDY